MLINSRLGPKSRATALKLASLGATLSLRDINQEGLRTLLTELPAAAGTPHTVFPCDVGDSAQCDAAVADTLKTHGGRLDCVFNCAGINPTTLPITETTDAYFDKLVNANLRGPFNITRAVVPHLTRGAAIVNVASVEGLRASAGYSIVSPVFLPGFFLPFLFSSFPFCRLVFFSPFSIVCPRRNDGSYHPGKKK